MHVGPVENSLLELREVPVRDGLRVVELLGEHLGDADLVGVDVRVGRDDGASREVHSLPHHMLTKQALLLFQQL